jgi:hypothetical protein
MPYAFFFGSISSQGTSSRVSPGLKRRKVQG